MVLCLFSDSFEVCFAVLLDLSCSVVGSLATSETTSKYSFWYVNNRCGVQMVSLDSCVGPVDGVCCVVLVVLVVLVSGFPPFGHDRDCIPDDL